MKTAKQLIIPFSWENRRSVFIDPRFLYIPAKIAHEKGRYIPNVTQKLEFGPSQSPAVGRSHLAHISNMGDDEIGRSAGAFASAQNQFLSDVRYTFFDYPTIHTEYCSGTGAWVIEKAKGDRKVGWIAVEKKFERAKKIWLKAQKESLDNVLVVCSDALDFTRYYSPRVQNIFVNFPDPWPKRKHKKHRLIQTSFLQEVSQCLDLHGNAVCVTDDSLYACQMLQEFVEAKGWKLNFHIHEWPEYGNSFFHSLWESKGKTIHYLSHQKVL